MASTTSDLTLLGRKLGALDYNPELYVKEIARRSVGGHELLQQRSNIKTLSESTHSQLKKNVYQNYRQFIDTAKEISFLESEMYQLSHMITDQRNLLSELMQFSVSGEKVDPINDVESIKESPDSRSSTGAAGSANSEKAEVIKKAHQSDFQEGRKKLLELLDKVEGCSHVLDVPTRYLMHNADMVEMDVTENTALHRVHGYLTNDGFMVATWLPNRRGPVRYKYSCFYELDSLAVVNVRDLGGIKHTFKLLVFPEPRLFQCANAEAKKAWMDAFERAKTDSKKVDVLSGTSSEADTTVRASYRAKSARQKPPRKANGSTLSTHADANNPFFDDKIEDQSLHGLEGEDGGHECKPREDIVLPEWLVELPEDLEVYIAQREFVQAVDLVLKATEFCHNTIAAAISNKGEVASVVVQEAWQNLEARIEHLIQVLSRELSTEKSYQGGPRAARNAVQLLCRLGRSAQAVELFLQHREAILQASLRSSKIESATGTYVQRQSVTFFAGVLESSVEFRKAFCQQPSSVASEIEEIEASTKKMSSLLVWIREQMIRFLERIDKQIFSPSTPLETISVCVESLRSQANNTLRHSGIDLLFLVDAHLRRNVERTICEHRDKHVDAVKLRAQEDKWEPINCFNKAGTERFLEEMATAGLPSVRSYVQDQCFVALTRNTTSFSLSYLNLADSLLRLFCPSMRALVNESLVTVFHAHLRHIDQALRSERLKQVDPKFVQRNAAFLLDTLLSLVEHKYHQKTGSDCPKLGKLHSSYSWLKDGSRIPSAAAASSSASSTSVTTTKYTDPSYV